MFKRYSKITAIILSTAAVLALAPAWLGWDIPPWARSVDLIATNMTVEGNAVKISENRLLILDAKYGRLLADKRKFQLASKPVPQSLIEQIREACRKLKAVGGVC